MPKTHGHFHDAIVEHHRPNQGHPQYQLWLDYALSTNARGAGVLDTLRQVTPQFRAKRWLDIGCAYGGTCVAAAQAGATPVGIDIDEKLLTFAHKNSQDHPELGLDFRRLDVMQWQELEPLGQFDIITCDNVIEHVAVPERLVAHIRRLLAPRGYAYITIPNAFSLGQVRKDCHYGIFGISLLDPWDAAVYLQHALSQSSYDVSLYYRYAVYQGFLEKYGLSVKLLNPLDWCEGEVDALAIAAVELDGEFRRQVEKGAMPPTIQHKLDAILQVYRTQLTTAVETYRFLPRGTEQAILARDLVRDYREEVWFVLAARTHFSSLTSSLQRLLRRLSRAVRSTRAKGNP